MPAAQQAPSVVIMPTLKRKIATAAAIESTSAHGSTLVSFGASNASPKLCTGTVSRKTPGPANQTARLRTTPTIAAVIAESAAFRLLLSRSFSAKGAPKKIQRKQGTKVVQVASSPPSVPATMGERP